MRNPYPSDITREQFALIQQDLETVKKTMRPRKIDIYEVFCTILYLLKNACTWRALPHDFPDYRYVIPKEASKKRGIFEQRIQKLCEADRIDGVVRFSKVWAIPKDAEKPADGRLEPERKNKI